MQTHIEREEKKLFPKADQVLDQGDEQQVAEDLREAKQKLWKVGVAILPTSLADDFTKNVRAVA